MEKKNLCWNMKVKEFFKTSVHIKYQESKHKMQCTVEIFCQSVKTLSTSWSSPDIMGKAWELIHQLVRRVSQIIQYIKNKNTSLYGKKQAISNINVDKYYLNIIESKSNGYSIMPVVGTLTLSISCCVGR